MENHYKYVLGLDLGTSSIGWALVKEAPNSDGQSEIIKLGVRVNPLTADEKTDFEKGKPLSTNADRTLKRGARRNLQRFKLRRKNLIEILIKNGFITQETPLTEIGKNTTHQTLALRAKSAKEQISLEELAKVFLSINKKRGYKSSRKVKNDDEGQLLDGMAVAKELYDNQLTVGQYVLALLEEGRKYIPDFYRSDLQAEFDAVWNCQKTFYPDILTEELYRDLWGKSAKQTWKICEKPFTIVGVKVKENGKELKGADLKKKKYELRASGIAEKLDLELLAVVLQEINANLNKSSGYLGAISDRSKELYFNKETVGENLWKQIQKNPHTSLKKQVFYRQDYLDEFEQIWQTQAQFYPQLTNELKEEIRDVVIFYQRKLKSQKGLLSFCEFESWEVDKKNENGEIIKDKVTGKPKKQTIGRRVIAKSSPLFQEFKIWQNLNHLTFTNATTKEEIIIKELDNDIRQELFNALNIRGKQKSKELLKLLSKHFKLGKLLEWKGNFDEVEGNITNQALYNVYQQIAENEGYGHNWAKKPAEEICKELTVIFPELGINSEILTFYANLDGVDFEKQAGYQLWHLLYSAEEDNEVSEADKLIYGNSSVNLKKKLHEKFGFQPEYAKLIANIALPQDYGNLSSKALRKILPYLQEGNDYATACELAGYNHSHSMTKAENDSRELSNKLAAVKKNSLRNPVVEKILNQMVNVVNQIIDEYGKPDEVRIELARELKKSAKERADMTKGINDATKRNEEIKNIITKDFGIPNPTKSDVVRYRLYLELESRGYKDIYTNKKISCRNQGDGSYLFSKDIDIEHIIPKSLLFDDSFSNKTLAFSDINRRKSNKTALDFISNDFNSDLEDYKARVEALYNGGKGAISKAKRNKLLMSQQDLPDGFIERDLRNSQYIAKKAKALLLETFRTVISTTGSVTDKLREDWDLINVMKELNLLKYRALGLTEFEKRWDKGQEKNKKVEVIKDWTKRNDHRHHAMDALTVAFTTHNHIQYLNNLNARRDKKHDKHAHIFAIENLITKQYEQKNGKKKRKFIPPMEDFRDEAKKQIESVLISIKNKNKVVTQNVNKTKKHGKDSYNKKVQLTPRGQLHKETVYGKIKRPLPKAKKLATGFTLAQAELIIDKEQRQLVLSHLATFDNNPKIAFSAKTLKNAPIAYRGEPLKEVRCYEEIYTIRKEIAPDLKLDKVVDSHIRKILEARLTEYKGNATNAFSDLDKNPIWLNKEKGIAIKRVTIIARVRNPEPLHTQKDHLGNEILGEQGEKQAVDFVQTSNNHHVAIYRDKTGNLQERVMSFYEAVERVNQGLPIIDKTFNQDSGWEFLFTMKQNEMFVFPNEDFDINEIDLLNEKNNSLISKHLFRVQSVSSIDYRFRHHLESTVEHNFDFTYKRRRTPNSLSGAIKIRINHIGKIAQIGEY